MMYNQKLVASIKSKGRVLREFKDTVYIPFGSEYSFLIKNLNTVRAVVNIFIDGENVVPGGLVVDSGRTIELERWIRNGNLSEGNRFKFIERTAAIENGPRGIKLEDGLIRVEYQFELPRPVLFVNNNTTATPYYSTGVRTPTTSEYPGVTDRFTIQSSGVVNQVNVGGVLRGVDYSAGETTRAAASATTGATLASMGIASNTEYHDGAACMDSYVSDVGITVPGSKSTQSFQKTQVGAMDPTLHTIVLRLVGDLGHNKPVTEPITVKAKPRCVTCGKQNKATAKFCNECGTNLTIYE
jgi:hypothetical protein